MYRTNINQSLISSVFLFSCCFINFSFSSFAMTFWQLKIIYSIEKTMGGRGSRNHLQAWFLLPLNTLKRFLFLKGKGVSFSVSKKVWTTLTCASDTSEGNMSGYVYGWTSFDKYKPRNSIRVAAMPQTKSVAMLLTDLVSFFPTQTDTDALLCRENKEWIAVF